MDNISQYFISINELLLKNYLDELIQNSKNGKEAIRKVELLKVKVQGHPHRKMLIPMCELILELLQDKINERLF